MRDGGVLPRVIGTEEGKGLRKAKAPWKSYEAQRNHGNICPMFRSLTKVAAREDDLDERSRDIRRRARLTGTGTVTMYCFGNSMSSFHFYSETLI